MTSYNVEEFSGIMANPEYEHLMEAVKMVKEKNIDFLLAVGGGSVIDGTKFIASAVYYEGEDPWQMLVKRQTGSKALPFGAVLTMPATGSEMNSNAVVTRRATKEKLGMAGDLIFPQFSVLDPSVVASIPQRQLANGITDAFVHVLEQYMTYPAAAPLQDRIAEGILSTLKEIAAPLIANPSDYDIASSYMWSCTMALNGLIQQGVPGDWSIHAIGHELTALYGIDHGRTLAIILPSLYRYKLASKKTKLIQYGKRIWGINTGSEDEIALKAINATEAFFNSLGIQTHLSAYVSSDYTTTASFIKNRFLDRGIQGLGENKDITPLDVEKIVTNAY